MDTKTKTRTKPADFAIVSDFFLLGSGKIYIDISVF